MLSSVALLLVVPDSDDEDDTSLTYAYVCLVVRVQGWGRGWIVRKYARVAKTVSKAAWALWCRFELRVLESIGTDDILVIDEVLKAVYGPDVLLVD